MLYTGFEEIDGETGGINNGELMVVDCDFTGEYLQLYILYNLAREADRQNRQNIKNYDKKIKAVLNYEDVKFETPINKISVLGIHDLEFNALESFPRGCFMQKKFELLKKRMLLFKNLPIEQSYYYPFYRSADVLIKDLTYLYEDIKTQLFALCVFGWQRKIPMLKKVAQKLNIPVVMMTYNCATENIDDGLQKYKKLSAYIDKLVIVRNNYWAEKCKRLAEDASIFYIKNMKTGQDKTVFSDYVPDLFFDTDDRCTAQCLKKENPAEILRKMALNEDYINKYNFTRYLHLSRENNERFWAYIEVFQRIRLADLYCHIAEYKPNADAQELTLAAAILHKLLNKYHQNTEQIFIFPT